MFYISFKYFVPIIKINKPVHTGRDISMVIRVTEKIVRSVPFPRS